MLAGGAGNGEAMQVEPMTSKLKAPGTKRLKLKYDNLLSSFAFNIELRLYTMVDRGDVVTVGQVDIPRHATQRTLNPRLLSQMEPRL